LVVNWVYLTRYKGGKVEGGGGRWREVGKGRGSLWVWGDNIGGQLGIPDQVQGREGGGRWRDVEGDGGRWRRWREGGQLGILTR
jgi:hypothetical protein